MNTTGRKVISVMLHKGMRVGMLYFTKFSAGIKKISISQSDLKFCKNGGQKDLKPMKNVVNCMKNQGNN